ncbi:MAG: endonuclease MutS2, partial [Clostridia bacterium]
MIIEKTLKTLEYDKILEMLAKFAGSSVAKTKILQLKPTSIFEDVERMLKETAEADKILYEFIVNVSFSFDDIIQSIENSKKFVTLSMAELLKVARLLAVARNIKVNIEKVNCPDIELIFDYTNKIFTNNQLEKDIEKSILNENEMDDNASAELHRIRTAIKKANDNIRKKLNSYLTSPTFQNALQDNIITMRENRYVIPVKSECRSQIPGLIHDQSASGATVFIEPFVIVEMNNDLKSLILAEQTEIEK